MTAPKKAKPRIISLFSGVGGLDYGFEAAGFETSVVVELDHDCCETLRASRQWPVIERSIFDIPTAEMLEMATARPGDIDVVIGGPPCQPFSKSGYWSRGDALRLNDPRANTLSAFLRVVDEARPRAFLLENVEGLVYDRKDEGMRLLLAGLQAINRRRKTAYRPSIAVVNAADYGVPQLRERVFLVAAQDGTPFRFPDPTHRPQAPNDRMRLLEDLGPEPHRTAWDALGDIDVDPAEDLDVRGVDPRTSS